MEENTFCIPLNYKSDGTVFNGFFRLRNCAEGVVICLVAILLVRCLHLPGDYALSIYILVGGLGLIAGCFGVKGDPISVHVITILKWLKRRSPCIYNNHGEVFTTNAADLMLNQPQLRDALADAVDWIRNQFNSKQPSYIEGETFQFSDDPELRALRLADEEYEINKAAVPDEEPISPAVIPQPQPAEPAGKLNIDQIFDGIVLDEEAY